ncbi:MAG: 4'-phosphopantetheinyl transferase superfamily protein [Oscillospiraceae bacterium]|jgi:4'-phosphopantetheinyl transferase|nr:4'-phosphopantetheinyl transferase superfamily protein [Oscillospiraceae bacterium]
MIYVDTVNPDRRAAARALLRRALREEFGITGELTFTHGEFGKPKLAGYPGVFFNLSHCRAGAACAVAENEVGLDMMDIRPVSSSVIRRVCTPAELAQVEASSAPHRLFCKLWAVKEAYVKLHGGSMLSGVVDTGPLDPFLYERDDFFLCCFGCGKMS